MSLPKWNSEWEQPDPLRGRLGWARHHYVNAAVAVVLLGLVIVVMILGVLVPALVRAQRREAILEQRNKILQKAVVDGVDNTVRGEQP